MKVAFATSLVIIVWLLLATTYCQNSHSVTSHKPWECIVCSHCKIKVTPNTIIWNCTIDSSQHVGLNLLLAPLIQNQVNHKWKDYNDFYRTNNVYFCSYHKSKHFIKYSYSKIHKLCPCCF
jgi:hypothetical protein